MKREHAYKLRELLHKASASLSDEDALDGIELFPLWGADTGYAADLRVRYLVHYPDAGGPVYRSLLDGNVWEPQAVPQAWQRLP